MARSSGGRALLVGWPLRSVSPVWLARGASPTKDLKPAPSGNRPGRTLPATRTGALTCANPGMGAGELARIDLLAAFLAGSGMGGQLSLDSRCGSG